MGWKESLYRWAGQRLFERPARRLSVMDLADALSASGAEVRQRVAGKKSTPANHKRLRHIIGIERWGQRRLRVFLGDPLQMDGHHPYNPPADADWDTLQSELASARADTVALAGMLSQVDPTRTVPHNQFGPLTARGWLRYLHGHARSEAKLMR
jgi:hypothetical protein